VNPHGVPVCKERATSIRYLGPEPKRRGELNDAATPGAPQWTREQLEEMQVSDITRLRDSKTTHFANSLLRDQNINPRPDDIGHSSVRR